jgi:hypothetical protein
MPLSSWFVGHQISLSLVRMMLFAIITNTSSVTEPTTALGVVSPEVHQWIENAAKKKTILTDLHHGLPLLY